MRFLALLSLFAAQAFALSPTYIECQLQKAARVSPLRGCHEGTLFVSATDSRANYTTVQAAVDALPSTGNATILIGEGEYYERVEVYRTDPLTFLGQLNIDTAYALNGNASTRNLVTIWNNTYVQDGLTDEDTAVLYVVNDGGSFGNSNFRGYNINFENRAANYSISQALVTTFEYVNASFYGCTFASYQDTWYTGHGANTYVYDSIIYGETDYLFGFGTAWFEDVTLAQRACGGGLVAWQGANQTTAPGNRYGAYISNSQIMRSPDANTTTNTYHECYLGRPWNPEAVTVYLKTYMDDTINPAGFKPWDGETSVPNTTYYAEYDSYGPGADSSARVPQDHILTTSEASNFTVDGVFLGTPAWIDYTYAQGALT